MSTTGYVSDRTSVMTSLGVRPALHLNLKAVEENVARNLQEPSEVKVYYNGEDWDSLKNVPAEQKKWYDSSKVELSFPAGVKDANTYPVMATS